MIFKQYKKAIELLSQDERKKGLFLLFLILFMAIADAIGVAAVMPFLAVAADQNLIDSNNYLNTIYHIGRFSNKITFTIALGIAVVALIIIAQIIKTYAFFKQYQFAMFREVSIGKKLIDGYHSQTYEWFLTRHSSDLGKNILSEVGIVIAESILPMITLIAQTLVVCSIVTLILLVDWLLAIFTATVFSSLYGLMYFLMKDKLVQIGETRLIANSCRYKAIGEMFNSIKDVKITHTENKFTNQFLTPAKTYASQTSAIKVLAQIPRNVLELVAFSSLIIITLYLFINGNKFSEIIPTISLFGYAGIRLMPSLQKIFSSVTTIRYSSTALNLLHKNIKILNSPDKKNPKQDQLVFKDTLCFKNVSYSYPGSIEPALKNININISKNAIIGIVGTTGSGKSTLTDLILGLLQPSNGQIFVDGCLLKSRDLKSWHKNIGYVPQQIYLFDGTIAENIAFGINSDCIKHELISVALRIAQLDKFIAENCPLGTETIVGERGVRLSGGERQRIGIARALYRNPSIIILDEATSALDNITEKKFINALNLHMKSTTIIMIAHRLTTIKNCDKVIYMDKGKVSDFLSYEQLLSENLAFKKMAEGSTKT